MSTMIFGRLREKIGPSLKANTKKFFSSIKKLLTLLATTTRSPFNNFFFSGSQESADNQDYTVGDEDEDDDDEMTISESGNVIRMPPATLPLASLIIITIIHKNNFIILIPRARGKAKDSGWLIKGFSILFTIIVFNRKYEQYFS